MHLVYLWFRQLGISESEEDVLGDYIHNDASIEAADAIGMSHKTLLEYLLRLRHGERLGFNFSAHMDDGIGRLLTFINLSNRAL